MTLMMGKWSAVASNNVLEALFTNNGPLQKEYESNYFAQPQGEMINKYSGINVKNEMVDIYIIKLA